MKVQVVSDTLFKLKPILSSQLSDSQKVFVKTGTELEIQSYTRAKDNHVRLVLANKTLGAGSLDTWYAFQPDIKIQESVVKLAVVSDTLFKLRPVMSAELSDAEKVFVKNGTQFDLQSHLPDQANHVRVAIANAFLGPENRNTWYAYAPDVKISGSAMLMEVVGDTLFKLQPVVSTQLSSREKVFVKNGTVFRVSSHQPSEGNHIQVALADAFLGPENRNTWHVYAPDIKIEGNEPDNAPKDNPPSEPAKGAPIRLPGFDSPFYLGNPILPQGHFTWAEATRNGQRIPVNKNVVYGIIRIARVMEEVRQILGNRSIQVNSWYRDPATNRRVGGASQSRHLTGDAVDFVVAGMHPYDVYARLNGWWGGRGGLASATVFTHIDARGYSARWSYGF